MAPLTLDHTGYNRYWTGLLLIAHTILLVIFSINQTNNTSMNLLAIIVMSFILVAWFSIAKWMYESLLNNILEITFIYTDRAVLNTQNQEKVTFTVVELKQSLLDVL